jgi:hypothetical protein
MSLWLHKTTKKILRGMHAGQLPEPASNYIEDPSLDFVKDVPRKYWIISDFDVLPADSIQRIAIDNALLTAARDRLADEMDTLESYNRAFALLILDEFNDTSDTINEILDAIDGASSLADLQTTVSSIADRPNRTAAQLKTALRNKLDS